MKDKFQQQRPWPDNSNCSPKDSQVKPSKDEISSTQVTDANFALFQSPATQPTPPFTIDDDSSDDSEKVQEEYVIANEHEPDKEQSESFSETTHEMFSDVHSGTVEEGKD